MNMRDQDSFIKNYSGVKTSDIDDDVVNIIKAVKKKKLEIGKDIDIINNNDRSMKEVIKNGTIIVSIDWNEMGKKTAELINQPEKVQLLEPTNLIIRNSL